jgi:hypothetical protein
VVPEPPSEVTVITQSPCVGAARALVWHTLSEKAKERERIEARARVGAKLAEKAKELAAAARLKELAAAAAIVWVAKRVATERAPAKAKEKAQKAAQAKARARTARPIVRSSLAAAVSHAVVCSPSTVTSPIPGNTTSTTANNLASTATSPNNCIGRKVAFDPVLCAHVETLLLQLRKFTEWKNKWYNQVEGPAPALQFVLHYFWI